MLLFFTQSLILKKTFASQVLLSSYWKIHLSDHHDWDVLVEIVEVTTWNTKKMDCRCMLHVYMMFYIQPSCPALLTFTTTFGLWRRFSSNSWLTAYFIEWVVGLQPTARRDLFAQTLCNISCKNKLSHTNRWSPDINTGSTVTAESAMCCSRCMLW